MKSTKLLFCLVMLFATSIGLQAQQLTHYMDFRVNAPGSIQSSYSYGYQVDWGPTQMNTVTGDLEWITDNVDSLGCSPGTNNLTGKIAMIRRGACMFSLKAYHAQQLGAVGCVICNHTPNAGTIGMTGGDSMSAVTIPAVFLSYEDCELLRAEVDAGTTVNASFYVPSLYDARLSYSYNTPQQHIQPLSGISMSLYNLGGSSASNVISTCEITDPLGSMTSIYDTVATLNSLQDSAITFQTAYTPVAAGTYTGVFKTSLNPSDSIVKQFIINSDSTFSLDDFGPGIGGLATDDADFAAANNGGIAFKYDMGAVYLTGSGTQSDATSGTFALADANRFVGEQFVMLLYEEPSGGFLGNEQDYSTMTLIGGGVHIITPADTLVSHQLINVPLIDISSGADTVPITGDKQYMMVISYTGDGTITSAPRYSYTKRGKPFLSIGQTVYTDRLYMGGWIGDYAPIIRLHVQDMSPGTAITNTELTRSEVKVFPVPTNNFVNLNLSFDEVQSNIAVRILGVDGKLHKNHNYQNVENANYQYSVENLPSGVYFLHVQSDKGQATRKIVVN